MLWILLGLGVLFTIALFLILVYELCSDGYWDIIQDLVRKLVFFIALSAVGFLGICVIDFFSYYDKVSQTGNWKLVSIKDDSQNSGKGSAGLFYVRESIDKGKVYSFYYQDNDNGFKIGEVDADRTTIYEKDDCTPHVVEYTIYTKNRMNSILLIILAFVDGESSKKTYEIYIPKGTILRTFN